MLKRLLILCLFFPFGERPFAQRQEEEADLKAVFIYNFTKYIDWPDDGNNDFVIGIIGPSAVTEPLREIARSGTVNNKKMVVRVFDDPDEIEDCRILFIPKKLPFPLSSILEKIGKGMLAVSEEEGDAQQGTAFNFVIINHKLKFEVNLKALYSKNLKASSQLLKLAILVN